MVYFFVGVFALWCLPPPSPRGLAEPLLPSDSISQQALSEQRKHPPPDAPLLLWQMYTLLFEAMMLPRFGLFEDCESPPPPSPPSTSSLSAKDPTELAFAPRFSGAHPSAATAATSTGGDHPLDDEDGRFRAYLEPVSGAEGLEGEEEGGVDSDDDGDFEAQREQELLLVEGAAAGAGGVEGGGGGDGKGLSKMLPTARPQGYSDAQLGR